MALDVVTGEVDRQTPPAPRRVELLQFLCAVEANVPGSMDIRVAMGMYGTHLTATICQWFSRHPRFHMYFTLTSAFWLNQVERWLAIVTARRIRRGTHRSTRELEQAIRPYPDINSADPKRFQSTRSADDIVANIEGFCLRTCNL